jgi:glucosamine--fructose-6-phosphate aminotransferase (isomerizing)
MKLCGIFGCLLSDGNAAPVIHEALRRLEYRGYDSVGEATIFNSGLLVKKDSGKIDDVHKELDLNALPGRIGIGHTRWATHGAPTRGNAHPHLDCTERVAVVHNGVIDNFIELKRELLDKGHRFSSLTDTEVIPHLIEEYMKQGLNFTESCREAVKRLEGSYAIAAIYCDEPDKIVCARSENPLVAGLSGNSLFISSDIPALLPLTNKVIYVNDGEMVVLSDDGVDVRSASDWSLIRREPETISWTVESARKQGYPHFMLKEIHEQPSSLKNALRLQERYLDLLTTFLDRAKQIYLLACGTSYNACFAASYMFSSLCNLSTVPVIASEFIEQYGEAVNIESTILAVSQSGETADVLHAIERARFKAATILGLTNTIGSTLTRVSRAYLCQQSGLEIGVAASKTFTAQLIILAQLALRLAKVRGKVSQDRVDELEAEIEEIPDVVEEVIAEQEENVKKLVKKYADEDCFYFLGRGINTATALEGKLKFLEISYIPAISYPAGESKHGAISLIEPGFPVLFVCPEDGTRKALIGNIMEMKARGARIIAIVDEGDEEIKRLADDYLTIPAGIPEVLSPIPYVIPLQLFAYYMAVERGCDPDKPRNLAKSVTVL